MNAISSGEYKICNVRYPDRYFCMSGDKEFVGRDVPSIIRLNVLSEREHLVTLLDIGSQLFIGIDTTEGKVKGYPDPHLIELTFYEDVGCWIHQRTDIALCHLKDGESWTPISLEPNLGEDVEKGKLWTFQRAE